MSLSLELIPARTRTLTDTPFPLELRLSNGGGETVHVPDAETPPPVEYRLLDPADGSERYLLSAERRLGKLDPDPQPAPPLPSPPLAPGDSVTYRDDLLAQAPGPIAAGTYQLAAVLDLNGTLVRSEPLTVELTAPQPRGYACTTVGNGDLLGSALAHAGDGGVELYQRDNAYGSADVGLAHRRALVAEGEVSSLAVAIELEPVTHRWMAWIEDGAFRSAVGYAGDTMLATAPVPLGLGAPRLLTAGCQFRQEEVVFLASGEANGEGGLAGVYVNGGQAPVVRPYRLSARAPEHIAVRYVPQGETPRAQVVWAEPIEGGVRLWQRTFDPLADDDGQWPKLLLEHYGPPILALGLEGFGKEAAGAVDLLLGPSDEEPPRLQCLRVGLNERTNPTVWTLPFPALDENERITAWAALGGPSDGGPLLALSGARAFAARAEQGAWQVLQSESPGLSHPRLSRVAGVPWASWVDPARGIAYRRLP